jgi:Flp pilus assembly pilin Flp
MVRLPSFPSTIVRSRLVGPRPRPAQSLVEYALIITLISVAVIAAVAALGANITAVFSTITSSLGGVPVGIP